MSASPIFFVFAGHDLTSNIDSGLIHKCPAFGSFYIFDVILWNKLKAFKLYLCLWSFLSDTLTIARKTISGLQPENKILGKSQEENEK